MKTSTILASCALALLNTPTCLATLLNDTPVITPDHLTLDNISSTQNITTRGEESVPFTTCRDFNSTNSGFIVNEILLSPNPPVRGQDLDITVKGDLRTNLDKGAAVRVAVWKFGMPFVYLEYDWCSSIKGLSCPIEPGNITFSVKQNIEGGVPAWTYVLSMDIFNQTGDEISCLQLETKVAKKPKKKELKATLVDVAENEEFE